MNPEQQSVSMFQTLDDVYNARDSLAKRVTELDAECDCLFRWVAELFARQDECYRELARVKGELAGQSQCAFERGEEIARLREAVRRSHARAAADMAVRERR